MVQLGDGKYVHMYSTKSIHICLSKRKSYNMKVMENSDIDLLVKENFKRWNDGGKFDIIRLKVV